MARKNDLAKLAALAGLGMVLTNQYRNKVDLTEKDSNPDRKARPDSTENRLESQEETIKRSMKTAPLDDSRTDAASSGDEMSKYAANYKPQTSSAASVPVKPLNKEVKVSKLPKAIAPNRSPGDEMSAYAKGYKNLGTLVNPYPKGSNEAVKQAAISATKKHDEAEKKVKDGRYKQMDANILNNMITNPPMKKGGAVKMASGGMTASRRGDGIATKGKTRGKIC